MGTTMSKSVATESNEGHEAQKMCVKRGSGDKGKQDEEIILEIPTAENLTTSTTVSTAPATTDQFMHTPEFRRYFVEFVPPDKLLTMKVISKEFEETTREYIAFRVESSEMIFHRKVDIDFDLRNSSDDESSEFGRAAARRNKLVTQVIFLQNLPRIGDWVCAAAISLIVVDIPEGVERIDIYAFDYCRILTTVNFPTILTSIG